MKKILLLTLATIVLNACKVNSEVAGQPPFKFNKKTYQEYTVPYEGKKGITLYFQGELIQPNVYFESVFFRDKEIKLAPLFSGNNFEFTADYSIGYQDKEDRQMINTARGEYGNKPPVKSDNPFDLQENEAVILYNVKGKQRYYKVSDLQMLDKKEIK
ncbi:hypothetical protein [Namhaeicola litoreus]|uniref:Lipoprotein n=1 Tax=Namhaeicola litoreus TaxID=1052145 RepID=A0ABW3XZF2_9FLAO